MRLGGNIAALFLSVCLPAAFGQQVPIPLVPDDAPPPAPAEPQGGLHGKAPLTEQELLEQRIRMMDPLYRGDPAADQSEKAADQTPDVKPDVRQELRPAARPKAEPKPIKGSLADSAQPAQPRVRQTEPAPEEASSRDFAGPAVLSRGYTLHRSRIPRSINWQPTFSFNSIYNSGLTGSNAQQSGALNNQSSFGASATWAISGSHKWKRDELSASTAGNFNQFATASQYSGSNHTVGLAYAHIFSPRVSLNINESLSSYSQSYTLTNPALGVESSIAEANVSASPLVQVLDSGLRQSATTAALSWQKSARLSFSFGGNYFGVQRTGAGLIGNTGSGATGDVNYRWTRRATVGTYYSFNQYTYSHRVQISNAHTVGAIYSYALSRSLQIRFRAGITRIESEGLVTVSIAPAIAALLGQSSRVIDQYRLNATSDLSAEVAKDFSRTRALRVAYSRGVSPGNGVQLTSMQEGVTAGYSQNIFRTVGFNLAAGVSTLSSVGQSIGKYSSRYVTIGFSRGLGQGVSSNMNFYYRTFDISNSPTVHDQISVSLGLSWTPSEHLLRLF